MTGLLILLASIFTGIACYNLSCAFVDVPTAKTSRMMMLASRPGPVMRSCLTCTLPKSQISSPRS